MTIFGTHFIPAVTNAGVYISLLHHLFHHYQCLLKGLPILCSSNVTLLQWVIVVFSQFTVHLDSLLHLGSILPAFYCCPFLLLC